MLACKHFYLLDSIVQGESAKPREGPLGDEAREPENLRFSGCTAHDRSDSAEDEERNTLHKA